MKYPVNILLTEEWAPQKMDNRKFHASREILISQEHDFMPNKLIKEARIHTIKMY